MTPTDVTTVPQVPPNRGNIWDDLVLLTEFVRTLQANGFIVIGADGHYAFHNPTTMQIAQEAGDVEAILKASGIAIPPNVDKIIKGLPALLPLLGVM